MANAAIRLEREKRKTLREARLWELLNKPEVHVPLVGVGGALALQQLGKHRVVDRDFAGFMLAAWTVLTAAKAGITDWKALGAFSAAATAAYCVTVPPTEAESLIIIDKPFSLLGGDGKLFWWDIPFLPPTL